MNSNVVPSAMQRALMVVATLGLYLVNPLHVLAADQIACGKTNPPTKVTSEAEGSSNQSAAKVFEGVCNSDNCTKRERGEGYYYKPNSALEAMCRAYCAGVPGTGVPNPEGAKEAALEAVLSKFPHPGCNQRLANGNICGIEPRCQKKSSITGGAVVPKAALKSFDSECLEGKDLLCKCYYKVSNYFEVDIEYGCTQCPSELRPVGGDEEEALALETLFDVFRE